MKRRFALLLIASACLLASACDPTEVEEQKTDPANQEQPQNPSDQGGSTGTDNGTGSGSDTGAGSGSGDSGNVATVEEDDLKCPNPPTAGTVDVTSLTGYGEATTGGEGATAANILHFNNGKALQTWLLARAKSEKAGDHSPVIIWLSGTFVPGDGRDFSEAHPWFDVKEVSNISFLGVNGFTMDRIGFFAVRSDNLIFRNIYFRQPKADNGADAISMQETTNAWVDHCTFESLNQSYDYEDGSCDITHTSNNVTVSWCHFIKTQKTCLVGHSNSNSADVAITVTFHHNWFDQSSSRHPRVRYGRAHVYNNYYDGCTTYGAGSAYGAHVLVEYNYFRAVQLPTDICTYPAKDGDVSNLEGSVAGYLYACCNHYVDKPAKARSPYPLTNVCHTSYTSDPADSLKYADFRPSYSYTVTPAADVAETVTASAGAGKLSGFDKAPVDVNNGGVDTGSGDTGSGSGGSDGGSDSGSGSGSGSGDGGSTPVTGSVTWTSGWFQTAGSISSSYSADGLTFTPVSSYSQKNYTEDGVKYYYCQTDGKFTFTVSTAGTITVTGSSSGSSKRTLILTVDGTDTSTTADFTDGTKASVTLSVPAPSGSSVVGFYPKGGNKVNVYTITWTPAS